MNEKKFYLQGVETFLMFLVFVCVCSFGLYSNIKSIYNHFIMERDGKHLIGVIKKVSKYNNKKYRIEVSYEIDGETEIGKFYVKKRLSESIGDYFSTKYRIGDKIPIIIGENNYVIPYSERKSFIDRYILPAIVCFLLLLFCLVSMFKKRIYSIHGEDIGWKDKVCSAMNVIGCVCFIAAFFAYIFLREKKFLHTILLWLAYTLCFYPTMILKKKVYVRGKGEVSYYDDPGSFRFGVIFNLSVSVMFLLMIILELKY